jgi:hypothetical protein
VKRGREGRAKDKLQKKTGGKKAADSDSTFFLLESKSIETIPRSLLFPRHVLLLFRVSSSIPC